MDSFTYFSTSEVLLYTQSSYGQILLIIYQIKQSMYFLPVGVACYRDVRGRTNSTFVQLRVPFLCMPFSRLCVCLSPGPSVSGLLTLEDAIIPHAFNYLLILTA